MRPFDQGTLEDALIPAVDGSTVSLQRGVVTSPGKVLCPGDRGERRGRPDRRGGTARLRVVRERAPDVAPVRCCCPLDKPGATHHDRPGRLRAADA